MLPKKQSCVFGSHAQKNKILDKKVPENPKYKHVKPVVDSGYNIRKYIDALKETHKTNVFRMDEVFHRVRLSSFVKLAIEVHIDSNARIKYFENQSSATVMKESKKSEEYSLKSIPYQNVLVGIGELDLQNEQKNKNHHRFKHMFDQDPGDQAPGYQYPYPYLLLDVRSKEDYLQWHIITAKNYPYTMLSRSPRYETADMFTFKNATGRLIILYDEDESLVPRVATTLVQRGYDNIYVLTGGLRLASEKFPEGLIDGMVPLPSSRARPYSSQSSISSCPQNHRPDNKFTDDDIFKLKRVMDLYALANEGQSAPNRVTEKRALSVRSEGRKPSLNLAKSVQQPPWK